MSRRKFAQETFEQPTFADRALPFSKPIAIYYRQSSDAQVGNISTAIQQVDLVAYLQKLGWPSEMVIPIYDDAGVSGTKRIDERVGMRYLYELILKKEIGAVGVVNEDRLFRDETHIQPNIFIDACKKSDVRIVTLQYVYDFNHPLKGRTDTKLFREKCESAANYIPDYIRERLHKARARLAKEGKYFGAGIATGYMVDKRKTLADGSFNVNYKKYVPFEPYASMIRTYFETFVKLGGNLRRFRQYAIDNNLGFPNPESVAVPNGFKINYTYKYYTNGLYIPDRANLAMILTNPKYIGHWDFNDVIVQYNNHEPIVSSDLFFAAFNYVSDTNLDGSPNENYRGIKYSKQIRNRERPNVLLEGFIKYYDERGKKRTAFIHYDRTHNRYDYGTDGHNWYKSCEYVDNAICYLLGNKLKATFNQDAWSRAIDESVTDFSKDIEFKEQQLNEHNKALIDLEEKIARLTNLNLLNSFEKRYEATLVERDKLISEIEQLKADNQINVALDELKDNFNLVANDWDHLSTDEKRPVVYMFIREIFAEPADNKALKLTIYWFDGVVEEIILPKTNTDEYAWSFEDHYQLTHLLNNSASQVEIAKLFPDRIWGYIQAKIRLMGYRIQFRPKPIRTDETFQDYENRVGEKGEELSIGTIQWAKDEIAQLNEMLDSHCDKLDLVIAFPQRKWTNIRTKINKMRGKDFEVRGDKVIHYSESLMEYLARHDIAMSDFLISNQKSVSRRMYRTQPPNAGSAPPAYRR